MADNEKENREEIVTSGIMQLIIAMSREPGNPEILKGFFYNSPLDKLNSFLDGFYTMTVNIESDLKNTNILNAAIGDKKGSEDITETYRYYYKLFSGILKAAEGFQETIEEPKKPDQDAEPETAAEYEKHLKEYREFKRNLRRYKEKIENYEARFHRIERNKKREELEPKDYKGKREGSRTNATRETAGPDLADIPQKIALITLPGYENALKMTGEDDKNAFLVAVDPDNPSPELEEVHRLELQDIHGNKIDITKIDFHLLNVLYTVVQEEFKRNGYFLPDKQLFTIYIPDLAKENGYKAKFSDKDFKSFVNRLHDYRNLEGVVNHKRYSVLLIGEVDDLKKTVVIWSPLFTALCRDSYNDSIVRKNGNAIIQDNKRPKLKASHSYLVHTDIASATRSQAAIDVVYYFIQQIEKAGRTQAGFKFYTLLQNCPIFYNQLLNATATADKNRHCKRVFSNAWRLLKDYTDLTLLYPGITINGIALEEKDPDLTKFIPTKTQFKDFKFDIRHKGKTPVK